MLMVLVAIFMTASRAGFIDLAISFSVALYYFAIKGKRMYLLVATLLIGTVVMGTFGGKLYDRFTALEGGSTTEQSAYGSYEERMYLMERAVDAIEHYPIFGLGLRNFRTYSLIWHDVHMTYLQVGAEGGIPVLILYLMFFWRAFKNLKVLQKTKNLDPDIVLFIGALHDSLVGFVVGALFAPEAYQLFPYFSVAFTATLLLIVQEQEQAPGSALRRRKSRVIFWRFMPIAQPPVQYPLSADLQAILRCLSCGSKLESDRAGGFLCPACKRAYPNAQGIARFVDAQHYAASFGFQWHRYQKTQLDNDKDEIRESEQNFLEEDRFPPRRSERQTGPRCRLRNGPLRRSRYPLGRARGGR